jgi:hypothetical protein
MAACLTCPGAEFVCRTSDGTFVRLEAHSVLAGGMMALFQTEQKFLC